MAMKFVIEEGDIFDPIGDIVLSDEEKYIDDPAEAVKLISSIIDRTSERQKDAIERVKEKVNDIFGLFEDISLDNELTYYKRMLDLCDRLAEQKKIRKISGKTVIGMGGGFSAGKSKFINSVSGCTSLPEAQNPTTSIPTYVISSDSDSFTANTVYGSVCRLDNDSMQAMTHKFYDSYRIGFASFVDSIIVESKDFKLGEHIALLDTPGYTKFDVESNSQDIRSDKEKAYEQLKKTDRLIWVSDINNLIKQDDIVFITELNISSPILFVLNKADKIPENQVAQLLEYVRQTLDSTEINVFGVTAYSSITGEEYFGSQMIKDFFEEASNEKSVNNDINSLFRSVESEIDQALDDRLDAVSKLADGLYKNIEESVNVLEIRSVSDIWSNCILSINNLKKIKKMFADNSEELNNTIDSFLKGGVENAGC